MIKALWKAVFGKCEIKCSSADAEKLFGIVKNGSVTFDSIKQNGEEYVAVISEVMYRQFTIAADRCCLEYSMKRLPGIPLLYYRYKHRPGLLIGVVIFFAMILISQRIIWDFDITGNKHTPDTEIIEALENVGCRAGMLISDMDFALIQNNCLIDAENLAWISVNMDGNLARVEVRETRTVPIKFVPVKGRFANIIAAEDGVVSFCNVKRGKAAVEKGSVVKKGELLISGVIEVGQSGVKYECAEGEVLATVYREIESFVPFERVTSVPTGEKKAEIRLKIFGKMINLSSRGRIDYELYGKIEENKKLSLPWDITLPIWMYKTVYTEQRKETVSLTEEAAFECARTEAADKLRDMTDSFQVVSVTEKSETEEDGVRVTLCVYGVTDIAANYGFSVSDYGTDGDEEQLRTKE